MYTTHISGSHSQRGSHVSQEQNAKGMQQEIDHLKRKLRHARRKRTPSNSDVSFGDEGDVSYRPRSRTPPSESFSYDEDHYHECRYRSPLRKGLRNDAMSRVLNQIFRSSFTHKIEGARFPRQFNQPMFTIYNGRTDPVEHVSHFK